MRKVQDQFPLGGMLIYTILPIVSFIYIYISGIFKINNLNDLFAYFNKNSVLIVFCLYFMILSIYIWISFFKYLLEKPKKEILYLKLKIDDICTFIDIKGRVYYFIDANAVSQNYYSVLKTPKAIYEILEVSKDTFNITDKKEGYFESTYLLNKKIKGSWPLTMVYLFLIVGILTLITKDGLGKLQNLPLTMISLYTIIYDSICKYKKKKDENFDQNSLLKSAIFFGNMIKATVTLFVNMFFVYMLFNSADNITRFIVGVFCYITFSYLVNAVIEMFEK